MLNSLEEKIGYRFKDISLLKTALTHSSYANEKRIDSYERLEFLGDAILSFVSAEYMYSQTKHLSEGRMTKLRAERVSEVGLINAADKLDIGQYMYLSSGENKSGGREKQSIRADMIESIIAAIYLDSSIEKARDFIHKFILNDVDFSDKHIASDNKSELQELLQKNGPIDICYEEISESGPEHNKTFFVSVKLDGKELGTGKGKSKKDAEQAAAGEALIRIREK